VKIWIAGFVVAGAVLAVMPNPGRAQMMWGMGECRAGYTYNAERNVCTPERKAKKAKKAAKKKGS
jgi:hypothetical protein